VFDDQIYFKSVVEVIKTFKSLCEMIVFYTHTHTHKFSINI